MKNITYGCHKSQFKSNDKIFSSQSCMLPSKFSYLPSMPPITDQRNTSKCVAYSLCSYLDWAKNISEHDNNGGQFDVDKLYNARQDKTINGMRIRDALVYLYSTGLNGHKIKSFARVMSTQQAKNALLANGPIVVGIYVRSSDSCFWNGPKILGGHCTLIVGYNEHGFIIRNSWGSSFGRCGYTLMKYDEFDKNIFECWTIIR